MYRRARKSGGRRRARRGSAPRLRPPPSALSSKVIITPKPYTLHYTACSLHPSPYTCRHTAYTLHPTPQTLNPFNPIPNSSALTCRANTAQISKSRLGSGHGFHVQVIKAFRVVPARRRWRARLGRLAPWEFEFPFPGSLTSTCLGRPSKWAACRSRPPSYVYDVSSASRRRWRGRLGRLMPPPSAASLKVTNPGDTFD